MTFTQHVFGTSMMVPQIHLVHNLILNWLIFTYICLCIVMQNKNGLCAPPLLPIHTQTHIYLCFPKVSQNKYHNLRSIFKAKMYFNLRGKQTVTIHKTLNDTAVIRAHYFNENWKNIFFQV